MATPTDAEIDRALRIVEEATKSVSSRIFSKMKFNKADAKTAAARLKTLRERSASRFDKIDRASKG